MMLCYLKGVHVTVMWCLCASTLWHHPFHSMSIVQLRIELPTYAHSFSIHVPDTCTIFEVKKEISRICPGRPRVDGQKLIWRGRFLADDEKVDTIWKVSLS